MVFDSIKHLLKDGTDLLIVCRESDSKCIKQWSNVHPSVIIKTVPHYDITGRHNYDALVKKRNIARQYAVDNNYDYLFFIDSDIIINKDTFNMLVKGCNNADVCLVPYHVKWYGNIAVGVVDSNTESGFNIKEIKHDPSQQVEYDVCAIGGMGCTLLNKKAMMMPFEYKQLHGENRNVFGEDIGYFVNAHKNGIVVKYLKNHPIKHL